jgi:CBS-domain-containing membrane protein
MSIESVMQRPVSSCAEDDDVDEVAALMGREQVRRLPVVDEQDRLVGIVSLSDLAVHALDAQSESELRTVATAMGKIGRHRLPAADGSRG